MATRFYLKSSNAGISWGPAAGPSHGFDGGWSSTASMSQKPMHTQRYNSSPTEFSSEALTVVTANQLMGVMQCISRPLAHQIIPAGSLVNGGQIRCRESGITANFGALPLSLRLAYDPPGFGWQERLVIASLGSKATNSEFPTSLTNRRFYAPGAVLNASQVEVLEADRLVFEFGVQNTAISILGAQGIVSVGDNNATDLPIDTTTTAAQNPWIEFDYTFLFLNREMLATMGMG